MYDKTWKMQQKINVKGKHGCDMLKKHCKNENTITNDFTDA